MDENYSNRLSLVKGYSPKTSVRGKSSTITKVFVQILVLVFVLAVNKANAQSIITGTVTDQSSGDFLPGVAIQIKGTSTGTISDIDGNFKITAKSTDVLVFSYVGFTNQEITVGNQTTISVVLEEDITQLSEVIVTALGIEREEKSLGYAIASVGTEELVSAGNMNVGSALTGKLAGVRVATANGGAASAVNIQVRGASSISFNTQPLYVIDGVPMRNDALINLQNAGSNNNFWNEQRVRENGLIDINPEDIETITVLKGASASALYGSDGGNGVVVITTKKGTSKKKGLGVDLKLQYDMEQLAFQPDWQNSYGPGYDGANNEAITGNREGWITEDDGAIHPYYGAYGQFGPKFDGRTVKYWDGTDKTYAANEDNYKDFFNTGYNKNINVAISNSGDNGSFRLSYARQDYEGIMPGFEMKKNNFNFNGTMKLHDKVSVDLVSSFINNTVHNRPYMLNQVFGSYGGFFSRMDDMSVYQSRYQTSEGYRYVTYDQNYNDEEKFLYRMRASNLLDYHWNQLKNSKDETTNRFLNSVTVKYQISPKFMIRGRLGNDYTSTEHETKEYSQYASAFGYTGTYRLQNGNYSLLYGDALASYSETLSSNVKMNLSVGGTFRQDRYLESTSGTNGGLVIENYFKLVNSSQPLNGGSQVNTYERNNYNEAGFAIAEFSFKDYLFLQGTGRYEARSTLAADKNAYFYPSANASFVFSDAFEMPSFIDYGKVRASWGLVGNPPTTYAAAVTYSLGSVNTSNGAVIYQSPTSSNYGNEAIDIEVKRETEFGLEVSLFGGKVSLDAAYYNNVIRNQIINVATPASAGASSMLANVGTLSNEGVEFAINTTPVMTGNFRWDLGFNYGFNKNKLTELAEGVDYLTSEDKDGGSLYIRAEEGETLGNIYVLPTLTDENGNKIVGENGLYSLDNSGDYINVGNIMPKAVGGITNTFSYKDFTLNIVADYRFGAKMVSTPYLYMKGAGMFESTMQYRDAEHGGLSYDIVDGVNVLNPSGQYHDGVILEGVTASGEPNTTVIDAGSYYMNSYTWGGFGGGYDGQYSEAVMDNSFIKLREASLTYNLPKELVSRVGLQQTSLSIVGRNLFYIWKNTPDNWDPEAAIGNSWIAQGVDNYAAAPTRSLGVILRAKF
ncbi:SusC/RagA family TonB-linked outer membrane protein [Flammeovirgaceae bacterium SG7u.111]|nr:SusC/RagA family TonB-linked outer membrane protein [Flammeovirgaceae bacterium SG7u.132]WPO35714.1 SusC/RagA family TonB-linked outer membrane protein [Flammeovirgaceae bacterium SG7u.111]